MAEKLNANGHLDCFADNSNFFSTATLLAEQKKDESLKEAKSFILLGRKPNGDGKELLKETVLILINWETLAVENELLVNKYSMSKKEPREHL
jgi:hypothetical protein